MPILNLKANTPAQQLVKEHLEKSASATLADKINHGVKIQKDGKTVINKKDMDGFMRFAFEQAKKQANKSKDNAFVEDPVVYGWAIHYFEEESIEGTLYNEDGTVYKPAQTSVTRSPAPIVSPIPSEKKPKPQMSLFELTPSPLPVRAFRMRYRYPVASVIVDLCLEKVHLSPPRFNSVKKHARFRFGK